MDLAETELGTWLASGQFPITPQEEPPRTAHFKVTDNQFDPCADFSWVRLVGSVGTVDDPGGTRGSTVNFVVVFTGSRMVTDTTYPLVYTFTSDPIFDGTSLNIDYATTYNGPDLQGFGHMSYSFDGEKVTFNQTGTESFGELDPTKMVAGGTLKPQGNLHFHSTTPEITGTDVKPDEYGSYSFRLPLAGELLYCGYYNENLDHPSKFYCWGAESITWEPTVIHRPGGLSVATTGMAIGPSVNFSTGEAYIQNRTDAPGSNPYPELPINAISKVGQVYFDVLENETILWNKDYAFSLTPAGIQQVPLGGSDGNLDTSRHLTDLTVIEQPLPDDAVAVPVSGEHQVFTSGPTSAGFAEAVYQAWLAAGEPTHGTVTADSPVTGETYDMSCADLGSAIHCSGGNDANVYIK